MRSAQGYDDDDVFEADFASAESGSPSKSATSDGEEAEGDAPQAMPGAEPEVVFWNPEDEEEVTPKRAVLTPRRDVVFEIVDDEQERDTGEFRDRSRLQCRADHHAEESSG